MIMKPRLTSTEIEDANNAVTCAERMRITVVAKVQETCAHPEIREAPAACGLEPMRVCLNCGITESGYSFLVLTKPESNGLPWAPAPIGRRDMYAVRKGVTISGKDHGRLLRLEATVVDLIQEWRKAELEQ